MTARASAESLRSTSSTQTSTTLQENFIGLIGKDADQVYVNNLINLKTSTDQTTDIATRSSAELSRNSTTSETTTNSIQGLLRCLT